MRNMITCFFFMTLLALCGCGVISKDIRREAVPITGLEEVRNNPDKFKEKTIIVGGEIINVLNHEDESTTLIVLALPLSSDERPDKWENNQGRFMVRTTQFLDPMVYSKGREVTVAGIVVGTEHASIGKTMYRYVVIKARQIYLWPHRYISNYYYPPYPRWYWYHYGYYDYWWGMP